jgi:tetratricopeptide (TPR) repeat protein
LSETIKSHPDHISLHRNLYAALEQQQRIDEATEQFRKIAELQPEQPNNASHFAALLLRAGKPAEAEAVLRDAITRHPGVTVLYETLGQALINQNRHQDAIAELRIAAELPGASFNMYMRLGHLLDSAGVLAEAQQVYERAVAADPNSTDARKKLTSVIDRRGYMEAIPDEEEVATDYVSVADPELEPEAELEPEPEPEPELEPEPEREHEPLAATTFDAHAAVMEEDPHTAPVWQKQPEPASDKHDGLFNRLIRRSWRAGGRKQPPT